MADVLLTATNPADSSVVPVACNEKGELKLEEIPDQSFDGNLEGDLNCNGSFMRVGGLSSTDPTLSGVECYKIGLIALQCPQATDANTEVFRTAHGRNFTSQIYANGSAMFNGGSIRFHGDGSVTFAGNKAGFTAEGYLWCTTRRGDTVILDATSNGLASWVPYTPPSRLTELQDRWSEKDGILPVPHDSSQDEPETPQ